jgi:hypothetical protein
MNRVTQASHRERGVEKKRVEKWFNGGGWDDDVSPVSSGNASTRTAPPITPFTPSTGGRSFDEYRNTDKPKP